MCYRRAFTLIELLVVVAIISLLAMISTPNLLEAQARSKVSAVKNNMRVVAGRLETYHVDYGRYPSGFSRFVNPSVVPNGTIGWPSFPEYRVIIMGALIFRRDDNRESLDLFSPFYPSSSTIVQATRPCAGMTSSTFGYLTGGLVYFNHKFMDTLITDGAEWNDLEPDNWRVAHELAGEWSLHSLGPSLLPYYVSSFDGGGISLESDAAVTSATGIEKSLFREYDPTNGTVSLGRIYRTQRNPAGLGTHILFYPEVQVGARN
jgi:prepilin-type N-terminal cleavage/methylation domain-containing protein